ncbi:class I adenylate-forming enzyme family protein [Sphingomicrobium clamense]|uniref:Acyl--CoA ligase n=1 Tax=Sphingomicrobium clamense TaxID=2851013 RepID=A0ABS6V3S7_9SPHN|nr:class I adenylate-forming enzyme family protein [Sphingomicrobium sp. B8]MBW0144210.1 acyl--CoA ligase [Sphingomicrobium sp. B8]
MPSALDQQYEAVLGMLTGEGGMLQIAETEDGRKYVSNFPPTLPGMFDAFAMMNADKLAVISGDERLTFAELNALSTRLAKALVARGTKKGDRIAIAMRNCTAWIVAYQAILKAGGVATLINGWWREGELTHALKLTEPAMVIAAAPHTQMVQSLGLDLDVVDVDIAEYGEKAFGSLMIGGHDAIALPTVTPDDDATILFTSGSTGDAKGALSTHMQVAQAAYIYTVSLMVLKGVLTAQNRYEERELRQLVAVPLFHVTGEVPTMLTSYVIGRALVLMHKWDAEEALRLTQEEGITHFTGVPTMAAEMLTHPKRDEYDLSSLGYINSGGAPRPAAHVQKQAEEMPKMQSIQGYGLTETNAVGCGIFFENYLEKPTSTGRAQVPFVEVGIFDDDGKSLDQGEKGEVGLRSIATIKEYYRNPEATAAAYTDDGYFLSGDIGYLDEEGYLFIVDRKKDIIIRGGENIAAAEVEGALYAIDGVEECAVIAAKDERLGEVPLAIVHGDNLDEASLRDTLCKKLAAFKVPDRFIFSDDPLPKLGTGKIDRVSLKAKHGG